MTNSFKFRPTDVGLPSQRIILDLEGEQTQEFPVPGFVIPENNPDRFWAMYNKLVELGAIPDRQPLFNP